MDNLLFDIPIIQPRTPAGQWVDRKTARVYDKKINDLRNCFKVVFVNQKCVANLLREKDEEIIRLKKLLK